jgi:flagellar assembly protein FliH
MPKAVFRPEELVQIPEKLMIESPTSFPEIAHMAPVEDDIEEMVDIDEYTGPTADDLRREAEMFKSQWEEEKQGMIDSAKAEAENIIKEAQDAAFQEVKRQTDEAQVIKQQAEAEAENIIAQANAKAADIENEIRQTLDGEKKDARDKGEAEGKEEGFAEGKAEVERLIERTQTVLERAQDKRGEILAESEQEIIDLVLLIARKVVKVISESQKDVIVSNVIQALRKVKSKGDVIIRVNLADLKLTTEHKQEFIKLLEGAKSIQVVEDTTVDQGGCIIQTDFGEIDARISSQLGEIENKILEMSPMKSLSDKTAPPVLKLDNLAADTAASSSLIDAQNAAEAAAGRRADDSAADSGSEEEEASPEANAALTASAALAALATMSMKGKRDSDKKLLEGLRKTDAAKKT